jgi:transposase
MDWKYALSLDLSDPGFDFTLLPDFRCRVLAQGAGQRFLDTFLAVCKARGWIKARGTQRTDSTQARLPKETSKREALARQVGADGYQLLTWVQTTDTPLGLRELPALEALRQIWLQQYYRCTVPGWEALR